MPIVEVPDPDWYLDNVLVVGDRHGGRIGPARQRQAAWYSTVTRLRDGAVRTPEAAAVELAREQGLVLTRRQARDCGLTDAQIRSLVRRRTWTVPRFGVLCPLPPEPADAVAAKPERLISPHGGAPQIAATAAALTLADTYISHESAALLRGLPVLGRVARPTLSSVDARRAIVRDDVIIRTVGRHDVDVTDWFGATVTAVDRTVVDVARNSGVAAGLVLADAALHENLVTVAQLAAARERSRRRPGVTAADRVIELACPLAESPLESLARLCLIDGGLPCPTPQVWIQTDLGRFRVDLLYEAEGVIVEADGELKYRGRGEDDDNPLVIEKRRQEALERAGYSVVRVSWAQVMNEPQLVVARVGRALRCSHTAA